MSDGRSVFEITGSDRVDFLQNLVTNHVPEREGLVYAALLSPQGKYLSDFFLKVEGDRILLDAPTASAADLIRRLSMYKLRADVKIAEAGLHVHRGIGEAPEDGLLDPRHPALGWRAYRAAPQDEPAADFDAIRVAHGIPEHGSELKPDDSYILEMGFERINGVDFKKGCYVGQEVTARMKHKTELRKGLARVAVDGAAEAGADITADGKPAGWLGTRAGNEALAYLRFDRAQGDLRAGDAALRRID